MIQAPNGFSIKDVIQPTPRSTRGNSGAPLITPPAA
jgi:hypothetical protein